jgi:hypothetical protein
MLKKNIWHQNQHNNFLLNRFDSPYPLILGAFKMRSHPFLLVKVINGNPWKIRNEKKNWFKNKILSQKTTIENLIKKTLTQILHRKEKERKTEMRGHLSLLSTNTRKDPLHVSNGPMNRSKTKVLKEILNALVLNVSNKSDLKGPLEHQEDVLAHLIHM